MNLVYSGRRVVAAGVCPDRNLYAYLDECLGWREVHDF